MEKKKRNKNKLEKTEKERKKSDKGVGSWGDLAAITAKACPPV